jgi:short-subunit dehydrogenase
LARQFTAEDHGLALMARRGDQLDQVASQIRANGGRVLTLVGDVSDQASVRNSVAKCEAELGPVDRLICNAGVGAPTPASQFSGAAFETVFGTNVVGIAYLIEAVLPGMLQRRSGHIVGISSLGAWRGLPRQGAYCGSKAAVSTMLESLRVEVRRHGISVTTIYPGFVKTPMTDSHPFRMPFLMEADDAARRMYRAICKRRRTYAFPWQMTLMMRCVKVLPVPLYDRLARVMLKMQQSS